MSEEVYDNFDEVQEDGLYKNENNCFDLEDKIELSGAILSNTVIKVSQIIQIIYDLSISEGDECEKMISLIADIEALINENPLMNKLGEIVICYIFSSLDFSKEFENYENSLEADSSIKNIIEDIREYKESFDNLSNFGDDFSLNDLDDFIDSNETLIADEDTKNVELDGKLKIYLQGFVYYLDENFGFDLTDDVKENLVGSISNINLEDFTDKDDLIETLKGVFKSVFLMPIKSVGILGDDDYFKRLDFSTYIDTFTNTYFSVFEFLITDFSLDFTNIQNFIFDNNSDELKDLRFMMYIFDSFKFDVLVLKTKIVSNLFFKKMYHDNLMSINYYDNPPVQSLRIEERLTHINRVYENGVWKTYQNLTKKFLYNNISYDTLEEGFIEVNKYYDFCDGLIEWDFLPKLSVKYAEYTGDVIKTFETENVDRVHSSDTNDFVYDTPTNVSSLRVGSFLNDSLLISQPTKLFPSFLSEDENNIYYVGTFLSYLFDYVFNDVLDSLELILINEEETFVEVVDDFITDLGDDISEIYNDIFN